MNQQQYQNQGFPNQNYQNFGNQQYQNNLGGMNNIQSQPNFLNVDFFGLTDPDYGAQDLIGGLIDEAYNSCQIFLSRKEQIKSLIKTLYAYLQKNHQYNDNEHSSDQDLNKPLQNIVNEIEQDTTNIIIKKRILETKVEETFINLADSFEQTNFLQLQQIKQKYDALGVLNIEPKEYLEWINIIKETQQKLNIITGYSNIIQNTQANIEEFVRKITPQQLKQKLSQFEEDTIKFINQF